MTSGVRIAMYVVLTFSAFTMALAFYHHRYFAALAVTGEASPGTWLSGVLLSCSAGVALVLVIHRGWNPWALLAAFLFLLAADEHFMIHERAKQWLAFSIDKPSQLVTEIPVFIGAIAGCCISWMLWRKLKRSARSLLLAAVVFGLWSVALDVIGASAMWEEILKLVAELSITCALLAESRSDIQLNNAND